jgi:hypothetical protein
MREKRTENGEIQKILEKKGRNKKGREKRMNKSRMKDRTSEASKTVRQKEGIDRARQCICSAAIKSTFPVSDAFP